MQRRRSADRALTRAANPAQNAKTHTRESDALSCSDRASALPVREDAAGNESPPCEKYREAEGRILRCVQMNQEIVSWSILAKVPPVYRSQQQRTRLTIPVETPSRTANSLDGRVPLYVSLIDSRWKEATRVEPRNALGGPN